MNEKVFPLLETVPTVPFVTVILPESIAPTGSENVAVIGIGESLVIEPLVLASVTVGPPAAAIVLDATIEMPPPRRARESAVNTMLGHAE